MAVQISLDNDSYFLPLVIFSNMTLKSSLKETEPFPSASVSLKAVFETPEVGWWRLWHFIESQVNSIDFCILKSSSKDFYRKTT